MEFSERSQHTEFRLDVRQWLCDHLPEDWSGAMDTSEGDWAFSRQFISSMAERRWVAPAWPEEYGGAGLSPWEQAIFNEETGYQRAPNKINVISVGFAGPTVISYGTDEQKSRFLPRIASGEDFWCQGFSEPDAGSDLASLKTTAQREGDFYRVNGRKTWTSFAHRADWMILLARTDPDAPKHKGISYFVVAMDSPGIEIMPLVNMAGNHRFNEVSLNDVRIPVENRIGEENHGWYIATTTLDFERSSISAFGAIKRKLDDLIQHLAEERYPAQRIRSSLADLAVTVQVGRLLSYRVVAMQAAGVVPNQEASMAKLFASETNQRVAAFAVSATGLRGTLRMSSSEVVNLSDPVTNYLESSASTIAGGTSEIQRGIIAGRGLGLPRG